MRDRTAGRQTQPKRVPRSTAVSSPAVDGMGQRGALQVALVAALLCAAFLVRWPFRAVPLTRDEAEYAQLGQQILLGAVPYRDIYNQKTPFAFYLMAAVEAVAGESVPTIRLATTAYGLVTMLVIFLCGRQLFGGTAGVWAAAAFAAMAFDMCGVIHPSSSEFYMLLWSALAVWLWYRAKATGVARYAALAGVAAGLAYQTKQTGIAVIAFLWAEAVWSRLWDRDATLGAGRVVWRRVGLSTAGFLLVLAATLGWFAAQGGLSAYLECTWTNNFQYLGERHTTGGMKSTLLQSVVRDIVAGDAGLWLLGAAALAAAGLRKPAGLARGLWLLLAGSGALALATGNPYAHYYEPLMLPLALGVGAAMSWLIAHARQQALSTWRRGLCVVLAAVPWAGPAIVHWRSLTMPEQMIQRVAAMEQFVEATAVADYLAARTDPDEAIFIVGSEPEIYFHARRAAATRMVITYPLTGPYSYAPRLRREFLDALSQRRPRYVVLVNDAYSLTEWPDRVPLLLHPIVQVLDRDYRLEAGFRKGEVLHAGDARRAQCSYHVYHRLGSD